MEAATGTTTVYGPSEEAELVTTRQDRDRPAVPAGAIEAIGIFALFAVAYALLGAKVVTDQHVVVFDALDRLARAFMVWHNDPPKLAAIGFSVAPFATVALLPLAAFTGLVTSGLALPITSAVFAGAALMGFNLMFAAADMGRLERWALVLVVGHNTKFVINAVNGVGDMTYMAFLALLFFGLIAWGRREAPRYLIGAGLAVGVLVLTLYQFMIWGVVIALMIAFALSMERRSDDEIQGSAIAFLAPAFYAVGVWILINAVVVGEPFGWFHAPSAEPVNGATAPSTFHLGSALSLLGRAELIFPLTLVMLVLLLFVPSRKRAISFGLASLIVVNGAFLIIRAASQGTVATIGLHDLLPVMAVALAGVAWLYYSSELRGLIWVVALVGGIIALPTAWVEMKDYPHQDLEQAFTRAISTGDDQEGTSSRGGFTVGIEWERSMGDYVNGLHLSSDQVLTDNARTYGVIALNGHPNTFFDRVDKGDPEWRAVLLRPFDKVGYMLVERSSQDLVLAQYPGADEGKVPFLDPVVENDRYALLKVVGPSPTQTQTASAQAGATASAGQ